MIRPPRRDSRSSSVPSVPYLNQADVRGLLSPGPTAPNAENRGFLPFLDQMGGLDGIISTMTKIQKMVKMFQSFGPMLNSFQSFGSMFGAKATTSGLPQNRKPVRTSNHRRPPHKKVGKPK